MEEGLTADEDQLLTWALDYAFFESRTALRKQPDPVEALAQVQGRVYKHLKQQLWRQLKKQEASQREELTERPALPQSEPLEETVAALNLSKKSEDLLLRLLYKREGEPLSMHFRKGDRTRWQKLRAALTERLRGEQ